LAYFTKTTSKQQNKPLKGLKMIINLIEFTSMKGHVADDCVIIAPSGRQFTLKNTIKGWTILRDDGSPCSGILPSALDVEYFVVNGLYSS
jgi:hypothetical protein